jgi:hypothetical protein
MTSELAAAYARLATLNAEESAQRDAGVARVAGLGDADRKLLLTHLADTYPMTVEDGLEWLDQRQGRKHQNPEEE